MKRSKTKRLRRLSVIILITVLSYVIFSMAGSVIVFQIIFARSDTVKAFELTYDDLGSSRLPREEFFFDSGGNRLRGVVYSPKGRSAGLVLVLNGMHACIDRHLPEILYFTDHGFTAVTFENTGVGQSEGGSSVGLTQARLDTAAAIAHIRRDDVLGKLPLVLYGHSLGGYAAATALFDSPDIRAAVCVSGFDSPNENMYYNAKSRVGVLADIQYPFMCLQNYFLFGDKSDTSAISAINATDTPVMIVGGDSDETVPDAISILHKADKITNPNAVTLKIEEAYRGEHSTAWLSRDAAEYVVTAENPTDKTRANKLDEGFMQTVMQFFEKAVAG